ncbi:MAG: hypothetical protein AAF648_00785 [Pseudomonadota bacterium]
MRPLNDSELDQIVGGTGEPTWLSPPTSRGTQPLPINVGSPMAPNVQIPSLFVTPGSALDLS